MYKKYLIKVKKTVSFFLMPKDNVAFLDSIVAMDLKKPLKLGLLPFILYGIHVLGNMECTQLVQ